VLLLARLRGLRRRAVLHVGTSARLRLRLLRVVDRRFRVECGHANNPNVRKRSRDSDAGSSRSRIRRCWISVLAGPCNHRKDADTRAAGNSGPIPSFLRIIVWVPGLFPNLSTLVSANENS